MISELGNNLNVAILANIGDDWQAFATWYSVNQNLPFAKCKLFYVRKQNITPFQLFDWAKRIEIPTIALKDLNDDFLNVLQTIKLNKSPVLVLPTFHMVLEPIEPKLFENKFLMSENYCTISALELNEIDNLYNLAQLQGNKPEFQDFAPEASEFEEKISIVSLNRCGKWVNTMKGCPFSSLGGLGNNTMTINERRIFDLWEEMRTLYHSIG